MKQMQRPIPQIGILADDLTSAADGGAPFRRTGLSVTVTRGALGVVPTPSEVWSVDCATRSRSADAATKMTAQATQTIASAPVLYKTIDSTLRGHIRAEIGAAFRASGRKHLVVAPAFPDAGRVTAGGIQYVNGVPLCQSSYADDPAHPATTSRIADLLPSAIPDVTILDAITQEELNRKVTEIEDTEDTLWVGSPGMAIALAKRFAKVRSYEIALPDCASILIVVGSANPVSHRQLTRVVQHHPQTKCLLVPSDRANTPAQVLSDLVEQAMGHIRECDTLIATGGDTMDALLNRLCICQFTLIGELERGFPLATATLPDGRAFTLGIKAGGFGDDATLLRAVDGLSAGKQKAIR
ncbi:hypothetical protein BKI51_10220 [Alphaproteobacteria bacterium AO1-B]|nr:hypothetical protein BKI51_10220 [Alphaproteobacteria bacterium AO1-B]